MANVLLSGSFLNAQREILENLTIFDELDLTDTKIWQNNGFVLVESYPQLNYEDKQIFDELAALACANYLSENLIKLILQILIMMWS
jgi:hypothetical protein